MARPRYTAAKRAREQKQKAKREAKLARKHSRARPANPADPASNTVPGIVIENTESEREKPTSGS
jgi:hypothetical protein